MSEPDWTHKCLICGCKWRNTPDGTTRGKWEPLREEDVACGSCFALWWSSRPVVDQVAAIGGHPLPVP